MLALTCYWCNSYSSPCSSPGRCPCGLGRASELRGAAQEGIHLGRLWRAADAPWPGAFDGCSSAGKPEGLVHWQRACQRQCQRTMEHITGAGGVDGLYGDCLLYTSDPADERSSVDPGGRRIIKKKIHNIINTHQTQSVAET